MTRYFLMLLLLAACQPKAPKHQSIAVSEDSTFLTGTIFLVRHAERNPGVDSTLTGEGRQRAGALYHLLKDSGIVKIYTTGYKRSIQTADSMRQQLHLDTVIYAADTTGESLIYEISRHNDWGKRLLVVGHANTLLPIMHTLKAKPLVDSIGSGDFSHLFIIRKYRDKCDVTDKSY
jgi:broad specificity phosphatase PhoE